MWSPWAAWDCSIPRLHFVGVPKLIASQPRTYTMSRLISAETKHLSSHADLVITRLLPTPRSRRSRNHGIHTRCSAWSAFCLAKTCPARRIHSRWISMISPISKTSRTHALMHKHQSHVSADTSSGIYENARANGKRAHERLYFKSSKAQTMCYKILVHWTVI